MSAESIIDSSNVSVQPVENKVAKSNLHLAFKDITDGFKSIRIWLMLSYQDIKLRYRRSVLGPFWITISMAITVYSMGYLYGHLFHQDIALYFPYLVGGMLSWTFIATTTTELVDTFSSVEAMIKQIKLPYSLYVIRVISRNILIFFHNLLVIVPVLVIFHSTTKVDFNTLFLIPGLILLSVNAFFYGLILALIGGRYRDISQIIKSLIQVVFFVTPVMWRPEILPANKQYIALYNPFYSFIEMLRCPLIGILPSMHCLMIVLSLTVFGFIGAMYLFSRYRTRIIYWM